MSLIKLSNGVEISENTIVAALEKAGIETKPPKPKHIFEAGDVAHYRGEESVRSWRLIINVHGKLYSVDGDGFIYDCSGDSQKYFEQYGYKFVGKLKDLLKGCLLS